LLTGGVWPLAEYSCISGNDGATGRGASHAALPRGAWERSGRREKGEFLFYLLSFGNIYSINTPPENNNPKDHGDA
jgi:hypothetical protein